MKIYTNHLFDCPANTTVLDVTSLWKKPLTSRLKDATTTTTSRYVPCETLYILEDALFWSGGGWGNRNSKVQIDQRKSVYFITKTST